MDCIAILNDINFVPYFLLNFSPAAMEIKTNNKTIVVSAAKTMMNIIIFSSNFAFIKGLCGRFVKLTK